jgi:tetratricopeptide (TPR) repeat protein
VLFTQRGAEPATWGVPLIADLGLAKHFRREDLGGSKSLTLTNAGEFRGTMCYMAPEQMKDAGAVGPAADVFSIGVILYEALAGHPAFESNDVLELVRKVNEGEYTPLRRERGDLPRWLEEVVDRALETDPARRFQDGHELARALRGARIGGPWRGPTALAVLGGGALIAATLAFAKLAQPDPGRRVPEAPPRHAISSQTTTALPATLPATVEELDRLMRQRYEKKDWKGVAEVAQRVIELDSSFIRAWAYLGEVHCTQGEYEKALGEYDVVVDANPDSVAARLGRAKCRYNLKRWEGVAEDMERARPSRSPGRCAGSRARSCETSPARSRT